MAEIYTRITLVVNKRFGLLREPGRRAGGHGTRFGIDGGAMVLAVRGDGAGNKWAKRRRYKHMAGQMLKEIERAAVGLSAC